MSAALPAWICMCAALVLHAAPDPIEVKLATLIAMLAFVARFLLLPVWRRGRLSERWRSLSGAILASWLWIFALFFIARTGASVRLLLPLSVLGFAWLVEEATVEREVRALLRVALSGVVSLVAIGWSPLADGPLLGASIGLALLIILGLERCARPLIVRELERSAWPRLSWWRELLPVVGGTFLALIASWLFLVWQPGGEDLNDERSSIRRKRLTGFTDSVELGSMGELKNDDRLALQLEIKEPFGRRWTHEEGQDPDRPSVLLKGDALDHFDGRSFRSSVGRKAQPWNDRGALSEQTLVQWITVRPHGGQELFVMGRPSAVSPGIEVEGDLCWAAQPFADSLQYKVEGKVIFPRDRARLETIPARHPDRRYLQLASNLDGEIRALAREIAGPDLGRDWARILAIESWLQRDGGFRYTRRDQNAGERPLSTFLFETRQGHCEYFASAMVVMLRCVGIPARLAVGFRGGTYNDRREHYRVLRSNAHAWVEVPFAGAGWVPFDPTPGESRLDVAGDGPAPIQDDTGVRGALARVFDLERATTGELLMRLLPLLIAGLLGALAFSVLLRRMGRGPRGVRIQRGTARDPWSRFRRMLVRAGAQERTSGTLLEMVEQTGARGSDTRNVRAVADRLNAWRYDADAGDDHRSRQLRDTVRNLDVGDSGSVEDPVRS